MQKFFDDRPNGCVLRIKRDQPAGALRRWQLKDLIEEPGDCCPLLASDTQTGHDDASTLCAQVLQTSIRIRAIKPDEAPALIYRRKQDGSRFLPLALDRALGHSERFSNLPDLEPSEITQLDKSRELRVDLLEFIQRIVHPNDLVIAAIDRSPYPGVKRDLKRATSAPFSLSLSSKVHDDGSHDARGVRKKVAAIVYIELACLDEPQISLVDERRRVQQRIRTVAPKPRMSQTMQIVV